nr:hypothetical protein B11C_100045 [Bartonella sp. 1-1C]
MHKECKIQLLFKIGEQYFIDVPSHLLFSIIENASEATKHIFKRLCHLHFLLTTKNGNSCKPLYNNYFLNV